MVTYKMKR